MVIPLIQPQPLFTVVMTFLGKSRCRLFDFSRQNLALLLFGGQTDKRGEQIDSNR